MIDLARYKEIQKERAEALERIAKQLSDLFSDIVDSDVPIVGPDDMSTEIHFKVLFGDRIMITFD